MQSLQTIVMGSTPLAAALPEATGDGRSMEEGGGEFAALLAMLFVPLQAVSGEGETMPLPEAAQKEGKSSGKLESALVAPAQGEGKTVSPAVVGLSSGKEEARSLGIPLTGRKEAVFSLFPQEKGTPAVKLPWSMGALKPLPIEAADKPSEILPEMVRQLSPGTEIAANLVSLHGSLQVQTTDVKVETFGAGRADSSARVVSIPLSAVKNGEAVIPVVLPSGEQVTLVLTDLPEEGAVGSGHVRTMPDIAMAMRQGERAEAVNRGAVSPAVSEVRTAERAVNRGEVSPAASEVRSAERAVNRGDVPSAVSPILGELTQDPEKVIRLVFQVRPETPPQVAMAAKDGSETGENIRMVLQARQAPALFGEEKSRPVVENGAEGTSRTDSAITSGATSGQAVSGIRVLNQSSRTVEVALTQEAVPAAPSVKATAKGDTHVAAEAIIKADALTTARSAAQPEKVPAAMEVGEAPKAPLTASMAQPNDPTATVREAAPRAPQAVPEQEIIEQVTKSVSLAHRDMPSEMSVRLKPEHLGNLHMKVSVEGDQVTVRIQVENTAVKQVIENNMGQLKDSFGTIGLRMDSVSVSLGMQSGGMQSGWDRGQGHLGQEGRGNNGFNLPQEEAGRQHDNPSQTAGRAYPVRRERLLDMTI